MAVIAPQTDVYLLKVPLEIDNTNQLTFANATAQFNYFNSLPKITYDNFTYQRKDNTLRIPALMDDIIQYNYVMYRNEGFSNKWFYAYIDKMEYMSNNMTAVSITTDVWQTWQFDLTYKPTFIEREHVNDDTIGANTIPENLEMGDVVANGNVTEFGVEASGVSDYCIVVDVSMIENEGDGKTLGYEWVTGGSTPVQYVNGIPSGLYHLIIGYNSSVAISARNLINVYDVAGLGDAIQNVYILPKALIGEVETDLNLYAVSVNPARTASCGGICMPKFSQGASTLGTFTYNRPNSVNGYTPKNKKLLCFPYNYMNVSNNAGTTATYRYEDFSNGVSFTVEGALAPSGSVKAKPNNYKNISSSQNAYDYGINGAKYPMCAWTTDSYTNWLTQNAINQSTALENTAINGMLGLATGVIGTVATGGALGAVMGIAGLTGTTNMLTQMKSLYAEKARANLIPDQVHGNMSSGDVVWAKLRSQFSFMPMSIKAEYARSIDDFFNAYGYAINRVKLPNITGRRNWNYVKTVGCYIEADIPQDDLQSIKDMFNNGVTFWHNASTFADYSQNNDII